MGLQVPSYLATRDISQLILVDALYRLEQGDTNAATGAYTAALKLTKSLEISPSLALANDPNGSPANLAELAAPACR